MVSDHILVPTKRNLFKHALFFIIIIGNAYRLDAPHTYLFWHKFALPFSRIEGTYNSLKWNANHTDMLSALARTEPIPCDTQAYSPNHLAIVSVQINKKKPVLVVSPIEKHLTLFQAELLFTELIKCNSLN